MWYLYVFHEPYSGGKSRHGAPVRGAQQTASINKRLSLGGRPPVMRIGKSVSNFSLTHHQSPSLPLLLQQLV